VADSTVRILLVDDDASVAEFIRQLLDSVAPGQYALDAICTYTEGIRGVLTGRHDVALIDYKLGAQSGIELIREARAAGCRLPLIVITGNGSEDVDRDAMDAGAADYLAKDELSPPLLERTVRYTLRQSRERLRAEAAEEQLRQAQKMEAVGQLAAGVAHDFNNLLTAIIGYAGLALESLDPAEQVWKDVEEIKKAGESAASLTGQLLAFSRRQILSPAALDLNEVVRDIESLLRRVIGEDIALTIGSSGPLPRINADRGQLEQVILNLAVNARDAMPHGGKLTIETGSVTLDETYVPAHHGASAGAHVMLAVSDTGVGMSADTKRRLFEPFFTTKARGKGTGLGLSMVYGTVKQSRGSIWVYSEPGVGSTFKIYLPVETVDAADPVEAIAEEPALHGTETILLVEDQDEVRRIAADILRRQGYTVIPAADGRAAVDAAFHYRGPIDLLITDVVMPEMSGRDVARALSGRIRGLQVLYTSGYTDNAIVHHGVLDRGVEFIQKPFSPHRLLRKVRQVLDRRPRAADGMRSA
jgi:signal transduction histidine kinase